MILIHLIFILTENGIIERPIANLLFEGKKEKFLKYDGVTYKDDKLHFWPNKEGKSHLLLNTPNPSRNWSFEYTINIPRLRFPTSQGIYMWYTPEQINEGKVTKDNFRGFVGGIEFIGNSIELLLSIHENSEEKVVRDYFDLSHIEQYDEITVKIIHTEKNMKIELHHDDEVVYDHLRLLDKEFFGNHSENGYFSISTIYHLTSPEDAFEVSLIKANSREENELYDIHKELTMVENGTDSDKIEIGHAIAKLEHFMKFFRMVVGMPKGAHLALTAANSRKEIISLGKEIEKLEDFVDGHKELDTAELHDSTLRLEEKIRGLQREMIGIQQGVRRIVEIGNKSYFYIYLIGGIICFATIAIILRTYSFSSSMEYSKTL